MRCRLCANGQLAPIISFGKMPLANSFLNRPEDREELFDLSLVFCPMCSLVQLENMVDPEFLFRDYVYFSSMSETMLAHAKDLAEELIESQGLGANSQIVEIASNDAYLLQNFVQRGIPVLGIDPAFNLAQVAHAKGVPTLTEFFGDKMADKLPKADVIIALNVLGHVPELADFVRGIKKVLKPTGGCVIEVPWVKDTIEKLEVDTLYAEHCFYWSLTALINLFKRGGLQVVKAKHFDIHGGSLRIYVTHSNAFPPTDRWGLDAIRNTEKGLGVDRLEYYRMFALQARGAIDRLRDMLADFKGQGQQIVAYGAAAKGTQLLNYLGVDSNTIDYVVDSTPAKIGKFVPGCHIEVVSPEKLGKPDKILLLAHNWANEVKSKHPGFEGKWIVPLPEPRIE